MAESVQAAFHVCLPVDLTAPHAHALHEVLCNAIERDALVSFQAVDDIDLAGVQLLLAFWRQRVSTQQEAFQMPLPQRVQQAMFFAGCLNEDGELDREMIL